MKPSIDFSARSNSQSAGKLKEQLIAQLRPVRRHLRRIVVMQIAARTLLAGGVFTALVVVSDQFFRPGVAIGLPFVFVACIVSSLVGVCYGLLKPIAWTTVASRVDQRFQLRDAVTTAFEFTERESLTRWHELQITQTLTQLANMVRPLHADGWNGTPLLAGGSLVWVTLLIATALTGHRQTALAAAQTERQIQLDEEHQQLADNVESALMEELRELAELTGSPGPDAMLPQLARIREQTQQELERLKQPGVDTRDALATLSRIQDVIASAADQLETASLESSFDELSEAFADSDALLPIAESIQKDAFDHAAKQLEEFRPASIPEEHRDALANELNEQANQLAENDQQTLSQAVNDLAAGIEQDAEAGHRGADALSELMEQQMMLLNMQAKLKRQVMKLAEAKAISQNGGDSTSRSEHDKRTWGKGRAGDPVADQPTPALHTERQREQLTGMVGEGDTELDTVETHGSEVEIQTELGRSFRPYQDAMETTLNSETIPLGHRTTIRRYFEAIRPSQARN